MEAFKELELLVKENNFLKNQLGRGENFFEMLIEASIDNVIVIDTELRIIVWNRCIEKISGIPKSKALSAALYDILPGIKNEAFINAIKHAMNGKTVFIPANKTCPVYGHYESHFISLKDKKGQTTGIKIIMHDISHRIKIEDKLRDMNKAFQEKNEELQSFNYVASHDLKEPIRKMYTFMDMLSRDENTRLSEKGKIFFERIQHNLHNMKMIADNIFNYSHLNTETRDLKTLNLSNIVLIAKNNLHHQITESGTLIYHENLPFINGYRPLVSQLFTHLLSNAIKFSKQDEGPLIYISSELIKQPSPAGEASTQPTFYCISFQDNGIGMEAEEQEKIFQLFKKLNGSNYAGVGTGLAICKKIMQLHQGYITVESQVGKGTIFKCFFPAGETNI